MKSSITQFLFPQVYRVFPYKRLILGILRALHILCLTVLVGGIYFQQSSDLLFIWVVGTIVTGIAMFLLELYASLILIFEVQSLAIIIKILLLSFLFLVALSDRIYVLMGLIIFSSLISHANRNIRHFSLAPDSFYERYGFKKGKD